MSEQKTEHNVTSLEDLFLSQEFGKPRIGIDATGPESTLFGGVSPRGPLVPMAGSTAVGHGSTTHLRRNRSFAAMSGAAAALLIAVGLAGSLGNTPKPGLHSALSTTPTTTPNQTNGNGPSGSQLPTTSPASGAAAPVQLASFSVTGSGGSATHGSVVAPATNAATVTHGGAPSTKPTPTPPVSTAPAPGVLTPVVSLVGHVVSTTGGAVTGLSSSVGTTLPAAAPVTNIVGAVGGTLIDLGDMLSATTA